MLILVTLFGACNDAGYALVSVDPIFGWTDGCNAVTLSGHGFAADATATIGGSKVTGVTYPGKKDSGPDEVGYQLFGIAPAGKHGYADVTVTSGGVESTITGTQGYYYVECPGPGTIDSVSPAEGLSAGALVTVSGCGLDAAGLSARVVDAAGVAQGADAPLTSSCSTAEVTFAAPDLPDGNYLLQLVDNGTGEIVAGAICVVDTADSGASCPSYPLVYGAV